MNDRKESKNMKHDDDDAKTDCVENGDCHLFKIVQSRTIMRRLASFLSMNDWSKLMAATGGQIFQLFCCKSVQFRIPRTLTCSDDPNMFPTPYSVQRYYDWEKEEFFDDIIVCQDEFNSSCDCISGYFHMKDIHSEWCRCTERFQKVQEAENTWNSGEGFKQTLRLKIPNKHITSDAIRL